MTAAQGSNQSNWEYYTKEAPLAEFDNKQPQTIGEKKARVLLVEDDKALQRYLEVTLERAGYEVLRAGDGLEAMKTALAKPVDLVISDEMMPNLSGHELCRFLRNSPNLSHIPIILLSGMERKDVSSEAGLADAFLAKPVAARELTECVAALIRKSRVSGLESQDPSLK
jgi:two-component system phosphate regulon response regulator PhoB